MIPCPYCEGKMVSNGVHYLRSGEMCRRFRCTCCGRSRSAYSTNHGESYKWDTSQTQNHKWPKREYVFA